MKIVKLTICSLAFVFGSLVSSASNLQVQQSRDAFWETFRTAVIKKDKTTVANLSQFPISMPYGIPSVRSRAQLIKRYRDVFNHEGDAAICFADAKPESDSAKPREFSVWCKNGAGDLVVHYRFVLTKNGWRFNSLDNINE